MRRAETKLPLAISVVARTASFAALGIMSQLYLRDLGGSRFWIGMSSALAWAAVMLFSRFWGTVSDVLLRRKAVILLAATGSTAMTLILALSRSVPMILIGRFLTEAMGAGVPPAALALLSERGGAAGRGRRISLFTTSQAIGFLTGSVLGGFLSTVIPFSPAFLIITSISSISALSAYFIPTERRAARSSRVRVETTSRTPSADLQMRTILKRMLPSFGAATADPEISAHGLIHLYLGVILRKAGVVGIFGLLMVFLRDRRGLSPFISGSLSGINPAAQALFIPLWGQIVDRFSRKRILLFGYSLTLLVPLMMLFSRSIWILILAFFTLGFGFAAFITGATTFIGDVAPPEREGELMGLLKVSQGLGGITGPAIAGIISAPTVGDYSGMFIAMAALNLLGLIITALGTRESRPAGPEQREQRRASPS